MLVSRCIRGRSEQSLDFRDASAYNPHGDSLKTEAKKRHRHKKSRGWSAVKWIALVGGLALGGYALAQNAGVPFDENDIRVVNFSVLDDSQKRSALREANRERCPCGCGMTLAQCVSIDSTCPLRETNIGKIRAMVADARR
jgi:hypothetical protein